MPPVSRLESNEPDTVPTRPGCTLARERVNPLDSSGAEHRKEAERHVDHCIHGSSSPHHRRLRRRPHRLIGPQQSHRLPPPVQPVATLAKHPSTIRPGPRSDAPSACAARSSEEELRHEHHSVDPQGSCKSSRPSSEYPLGGSRRLRRPTRLATRNCARRVESPTPRARRARRPRTPCAERARYRAARTGHAAHARPAATSLMGRARARHGRFS